MRQKRDYESYDALLGQEETEGKTGLREEPEFHMTPRESWWAAFGALKGALLIGGAYVLGGALLIWLMLALWT